MPWAPLQEKGRPKKLLILYLIFSRQSYLFGNRPTKRGREESGKSTYIIFINSFIWTFSLSLCLSLFTDTDPIIMTLRLLQEQPLLELRRAT